LASRDTMCYHVAPSSSTITNTAVMVNISCRDNITKLISSNCYILFCSSSSWTPTGDFCPH